MNDEQPLIARPQRYEVIVNNVGTVYDGNSKSEARATYQEYIRQLFEHAAGRAEWPVTLIETDLLTGLANTHEVDLSHVRPTGYARQVHTELLALFRFHFGTDQAFACLHLSDLDPGLVQDIAMYEETGCTPKQAAVNIAQDDALFWGCEF